MKLSLRPTAGEGGEPRDRTLWRAVFEAADQALEMDRVERQAFLARCLAEDPLVGVELQALIDTAELPSALEAPAAAFAAPFLQDVSSAEAHEPIAADVEDARDDVGGTGATFGPYRVRRVLGSGGMGTVYLAERSDDQYRKLVALKVLPRWSGGDRRRLERFLDERQILATLDHPHIARLLDGGVTADGLPWFAMEFVDGEHIDRYCEERRLSIEKRLMLFCDVCGAVQYAHRSLVVHRDLKPPNILVTADGHVALVDFGIARNLTDGATPDAARTTGDRLLTPLYSSPEQIRGEPASTAADVYALGVLLHALLTGGNPYRLTRFDGYAVSRAVLEEPPEPPSVSVARAGTSGTVSSKLVRRLRGDLDAIVLTALAKDPKRRYATVEQLETDVRRHLAGLPVRARPDGRLYHLGKFLRRHRVGVALSALAAALVIGFAVVMAVQRTRIAAQAERIALERDRAEGIGRSFLNIFRTVAPGERGVAPRDILDSAAAHVELELAAQPDQRARLLVGMADAYHRLGLDDRARVLLDTALGLRRHLQPPSQRDIAETLTLLGAVLLAEDSVARASSAYEEAVVLRRHEPAPREADVSRALLGLASVRRAQHRYGDAERMSREAMMLDHTRGRDGRADLAHSTSALAAVLADEGAPRAAAQTYRSALALMRETHPEEHPDVAATLFELAAAVRAAGDHRAADSLNRYGLALNRRLVTAALLGGSAADALQRIDSSNGVRAAVKQAFAQHPAPAAGTKTGVATAGSLIAFVSDRDGPDAAGNLGNQEIYVMNADGSGQRRLTHDPAMDVSPVISPDGTRIAFASRRAGGYDVFVMNVDGSDQRQVTHFAERGLEVAAPTWSPDGKRLAFQSLQKQTDIYLVNVDGSGLVKLTDDPLGAAAPAWSPDGRHIAYTSRRNGRAEIFVMDADGKNPVRLTDNTAADHRPEWSPDSKRIAFYSNRDGNPEIYVMNADGSDQRRLTTNRDEDGYPSWSPDGRQIVFHRRVLGHGQVFVMNADGTGTKRLTDLSPDAFSGFPSWGPARRR
jgi:serine/threonine-protein kinase